MPRTPGPERTHATAWPRRGIADGLTQRIVSNNITLGGLAPASPHPKAEPGANLWGEKPSRGAGPESRVRVPEGSGRRRPLPSGAPRRVAAARRAHQVPDTQQDGAGADMAAQAAAVGVEPRPGCDHLHRSVGGRSGASARPSLQERRLRCSGLAARLLRAPPPLSLRRPTPLAAGPPALAPHLHRELREAAAGGP